MARIANKELDELILRAVVQERKDRLQNVYAMADNLRKCPASEQYLGQALAVIAQALYDIGFLLDAPLKETPRTKRLRP